MTERLGLIIPKVYLDATPCCWLLASFSGSRSLRRVLNSFQLGPQILEDAPSRPGVFLPFPAELSRFFSLSHSAPKLATFSVYEVGGNIGKFPVGSGPKPGLLGAL